MVEGARLESVYPPKADRGFESRPLRQTALAPRALHAIASFGWPMWYVYIIKSLSSQFLYIGSTNDVERRVEEHNQSKSQSTKAFAPCES